MPGPGRVDPYDPDNLPETKIEAVQKKVIGTQERPLLCDIVDPVHYRKLGYLELCLTNEGKAASAYEMRAPRPVMLPAPVK